jgi:hypothetical protein
MGFEEAVQDAKNSYPMGTLNFVIADVRKGAILNRLVLEKAFHFSIWDVFCFMAAEPVLAVEEARFQK